VQIRHSVAAHREQNAASLGIRLLRDLDVGRVEQVGFRMVTWLTELHGLVTAFLLPPAADARPSVRQQHGR
jgi:hypothetical protein